jgi:hypothetical protein
MKVPQNIVELLAIGSQQFIYLEKYLLDIQKDSNPDLEEMFALAFLCSIIHSSQRAELSIDR